MHANLTTGRPEGARILLVDHDTNGTQRLERGLLEDGYRVDTCANPVEALERLRGEQVADLIVFDMSNPMMDGWQFRIQQRRLPRMFGIPVIAVSEDRSAQAEAIDADAYLTKPLDEQAFREAIGRLLATCERKRAQARQLELGRLRSLRTLAAGVAHEISDALNSTLAHTSDAMEQCRQALEAEGLEAARHSLARVMDALGAAELGATRLEDVVQALSVFAQPPVTQAERLDVGEALQGAIQLTQNEVRPRALLVRDFGELPLVKGSKARLGQVFVNLLLNAAQAIPEGHANDNQIRIAAHEDAAMVVIRISDTGRGIAPEVLPHIFEPFYTTRPVGEGMGLGLSICHAVVQALGGRIDVESVLGKGTVVTVALPRAEPRDTQARAGVPPSDTPSAARRGRVLVIDDEEAVCKLLGTLLSEHHEVTTLTSARQAVSRIMEGARYDVILCDLMMPEMTGMDLYLALQKHAPDQVSSIVFLSGGAFADAMQNFLDSVPNVRLEKPFSLRRALELVQRLLTG